jgi:hypothetical protein
MEKKELEDSRQKAEEHFAGRHGRIEILGQADLKSKAHELAVQNWSWKSRMRASSCQTGGRKI